MSGFRFSSLVVGAVVSVFLVGMVSPVSAASAAPTDTVVENFDDGAVSWTTASGSGTLSTEATAPSEGTAALSLAYDVSARAFEIGRTQTPSDFPASAFSAMKLDFRGDGTYNTLYMRLRDATGEIFYYRVGTLDKTSWTTKTVDLTTAPTSATGGNANGILDAPLSLFRFTVVRNGTQPATGSVSVDNLRAVDGGAAGPTATPRLFPAGSSTTLSFVVGAACDWRLRLTDSSGAQRVLSGTASSAGKKSVTWDGLSDSGTSLSGAVSGSLSLTDVGSSRPVVTGVPYLAGISARPASATRQAILGANTAMSSYEGLATADAEAKRLEDSAAGYAREEFEWNRIEPRKGYYDWAKFDQMVSVAEARNIKIVGKLVYSADWASSAPAGTPAASVRYYPPAQMSDWQDYVSHTVARYAGRVSAWEVWNEPNLDKYWAPSPDPVKYAAMLTTSYSVIKSLDPAAVVLVGGLAGGFSEGFMSAVKANGAGNSYDAIALHMYVVGPPESSAIDGWFSSAQTWIARNAPGRRIWITEFGWTTCDGCANKATEDQQAQYLSRFAIKAAAEGVVSALWYNLRENGTSGSSIDSYGLIERGGRLKPAYGAFQRFGQATAGSTAIGAANPSPSGSTTVVEDFASTAGISRSSLGTNGSTGLSVTSSRLAGAGALAVDYNYSSAGATGSLISLNRPVPGKPTALSLWVYGDSSNHSVFLKFKDSTGESFESKIGSVGTAKWKRMVYYLDGGNPTQSHSGGNNDGVVDYPIVVTAISVYKSTSGVTAGRFILDDLSAHEGGATRGTVFLGDSKITQAVYMLTSADASLAVPGTSAQLSGPAGVSTPAVVDSRITAALSPVPVFVASPPDAKTTSGKAPVVLRLVLGDRSSLTIKVISASGTVLKTLASVQSYSSGPRNISWDGLRSDGAVAAPGAYLFRVSVADAGATSSIDVPFVLS